MNTQDLADRGAASIHRAFDLWHRRFRLLTRRAQQRFETGDWIGIRQLTVERMDLHTRRVDRAFRDLRRQLGRRTHEGAVWTALKASYTREILGRDDFELAQTFFNSLTRQAFAHAGVDPRIDYVGDELPVPYKGWELASARIYAVSGVDAGVVRKILEDSALGTPFRSLDDDARLAAKRIEQGLVEHFGGPEIDAVDVLLPVFIRNKAAYVIGRARRGSAVMPIVWAIVAGDDGLVVDAVIHKEDETSTIFSFARWYFHADVDSPREVIGFLQSILPRKRPSELYISLGYTKHGKTEFYRDLMAQITGGYERFEVAPGQRGLVMAVFTLPSYEFVFKVIKDVFPPSKSTSRREVMGKYREVQRHDRVGRLVDFQEFEHVSFPRSRFSDALLEELLEVSGKTVRLAGDAVVIRHMYVGRRVTPLDIHLRTASEADTAAAALDFGLALKDLAAANIFTGDILLKNFGVTRHGRVVSYDYDELRPLTACRFRRFPPSRDYDEELSAEPWFTVAETDVFPEELDRFLGFDERLRRIFGARHEDLFDVEIWQTMQEGNRRGEILDFYPYAEKSCLRPSERRPAKD